MNNNPANQPASDNDLWLDILRLSNHTPRIKPQVPRSSHDPTLSFNQKRKLTAIAKIPKRLEEFKEKLRGLILARRHYNELDIPEELSQRITYIKRCISQTEKRLEGYKLGKTLKPVSNTLIIDDYTLPHIQFFKTLITFEFKQWDKFLEYDHTYPEYIAYKAEMHRLYTHDKYLEDCIEKWKKDNCPKRLIIADKYGKEYSASRKKHYDRLVKLESALFCKDTEIPLTAKDGRWLITHFKNVVRKLKTEAGINYTLPQERAPHLENEDYRREVRRNGPYFKKYTGYQLEEIRQARPLERLLTTAWHCQLRDDERAILIDLALQCQSYFESVFLEEISNTNNPVSKSDT